ncbi:uncharacterized protein LOC118647448 isoform X2 [Monomorium pharaonis]|uniref:uncharacterized protein LOC118645124 isoform X2 n=1 Tax=Monomorium pharaonis TaxID=307658 RepID=UPI001747978C|nr:uncharacterized protein LOC118645124 isoform X2 [Monomorium pharaonis]XP_036143669.1 uncharacterized protein LOC118645888 isoform X2 [Monomorium pharaonis]XP_036148315.1 uncharacterized protein LOC118647448 isoform X2 [Monomorium pharaonis]
MQEININYLFCVLQYKDDKVWVKIEEPCNFHHFIVKAEETFPSLRNTDFIFTDINNAKLESDILLDYVRINPRGVIIKIKTVTNIIDISFSQTSEEINIPSTSSDRDAGSSIVVSDISDIRSDSDPEEYASSSKKCKLNTTALENEIISKNKLRKIIKDSACGQEILNDYEKNKYLSERSRRLVVKIVVQHLIKYKEKVNRQILSHEKCSYAQAIIDLFPNLKNTEGDLGYEHFYNPETGTGYIASRLSNVQRKKSVSKIVFNKKQKENIENINIRTEYADETDTIKDSIDFMKHATLEQKDKIIEKTKETFKVRRYLYMNENFFNVFPRFLDIPDLIDVEFNLLFPEVEQDKFCQIYVEYVNAILSVYETEKNNISLEWSRVTNSFIALTLLLPPTARGKKLAARDKANNIVKKLIVFVQNGTPLHSNENVNQPRLVVVGPNKIAFEQCFLEIDKKFILLPTNDIIKSIDYLFKAHYVFHVEFENDLKNFWIFLQHYYYKIPMLLMQI